MRAGDSGEATAGAAWLERVLVIPSPPLSARSWARRSLRMSWRPTPTGWPWAQSITSCPSLAVKLAVVGLAGMAVVGLLSLAVTRCASPLDRAGMVRFSTFGSPNRHSQAVSMRGAWPEPS